MRPLLPGTVRVAGGAQERRACLAGNLLRRAVQWDGIAEVVANRDDVAGPSRVGREARALG